MEKEIGEQIKEEQEELERYMNKSGIELITSSAEDIPEEKLKALRATRRTLEKLSAVKLEKRFS